MIVIKSHCKTDSKFGHPTKNPAKGEESVTRLNVQH